jgi:subtilisin family serine protease
VNPLFKAGMHQLTMVNSMKRLSWTATVAVVVLATPLIGLAPVFAGTSTPAVRAAPVADTVRSQVAGGGRASFWVILDQPDLSGAEGRKDKVAKGRFVYQTLTRGAERSQAGLRKLLGERKAPFESFWIANAVRVTGGAELLAEIAARPEVSRIDADPSVPVTTVKPVPAAKRAQAAGGVEWNIKRVGADTAWKEFGVRGEGTVVANIDTGVQFDHPALIGSYRGRYSNGSVNHNYNWFDASGACGNAPCDEDGHGTHVMGIEAGGTPDGENQIGVAPGAEWIAASTGGSYADRLAAGQWMVAPTDLHGENPRPELAPDVVNNSWYAADDPGVFFAEIIDAWVAAGIFPLFAAGNNGLGGQCSTNTWPASFRDVYAVGNLTASDEVAGSSSRGPTSDGATKPDISAPGTGIRSAYVRPEYVDMNGTSQAAPHVAGAVALLWSASPELEGDIAATRKLLDETARDIDDTSCGGTPDDNNAAGEGLLDIPAALRAAPHGAIGGLTGLARRSDTGAALADARVQLTGPRIKTLDSDGDGKFGLDRLLAGTYDYTATAFGFRDTTGTVTITADGRASLNLSLEPLPSAVLTGVVRSAEGPVVGATVAIVDAPAQTRTGADGRYRLALPEGTHQLTVHAPSRCALPVEEPVTITADGTHDVDLPALTDGYGYTCVRPVTGYQAGTSRLALTGNTGAVAEVALPFPVRFYGEPSSKVWISTNGAVGLDGPPPPLFSDDLWPLPDGGPPNAVVYPFYSVLNVDDQAGVYTAAGDGQFVVEFRNVLVHLPRTRAPAGRISFSLVIGADGSFTVNYRDVDPGWIVGGLNALIGLEDRTGENAFIYGNLEAVVTEGLGFTIKPPTA